ncbi:T9SS type A sorting domain-containing protein [Chryseobacterium oranimense]|uniref:Por secretion system C-terminal sorting domain-containing protein n=1 Tax=Chryseobacterium oranimense TaxID=421058 RepID=A0A1M5VNY6_9FLAO|nr:T9SS type A sorting domain-containing protein [Chryseobacterium oranimense]CEJ70708.1 hypothetical protein BN1195_03037 [Chryseobacterium oranimense G311]SHH76878.1 Por secretion system C-terminal sorting domain-containing protein [Chryseobacterium oranimense]
MKKVLSSLLLIVGFLAFSQQKSTGVMTCTVGTRTVTGKITLNNTTNKVRLDLTGPSDRWFGFTFRSAANSGMSGAPTDALTYSNEGFVDRHLGGIGVYDADTQDWTVINAPTISGSTVSMAYERNMTTADGANDNQFNYATATSISAKCVITGTAGLTIAPHGGAANTSVTSGSFAVLGTNDVEAVNNKVVLYPNPAKETVTIKNADKIKSVDIYESAGRKIKSVKPDGETINVRDLKPGIYYFEITLKDGNLSYEKLIKE